MVREDSLEGMLPWHTKRFSENGSSMMNTTNEDSGHLSESINIILKQTADSGIIIK